MLTDSKLRSISIVLSFIGLADSIYLTWIKLTNQEVICADMGGCDVVNTSKYSEIAGFPIALIGASAYLFIILLLIFEMRSDFLNQNSSLLIFGFSLMGTIYSAYLSYLEVVVIKAICPYCVLSAIVMCAIFLFSIFRLRQGFG